jgi:ketosteroid isomerase-like protein/GNAT superfamily N-acetyltransferase
VSSHPHIRPFRRADREQVTQLVNAHVEAVVPGLSVSVNTVLSQLEREPGEAIVDPWVVERRTLVAVERDAVVAAAHVLRYGAGDEVGRSYRGSGEIRWLVLRHDASTAGDALVAACTRVMSAWGVRCQHADGALPAVATYGIPACWPHVRDVVVRAGFEPRGRVEIISVARVDELLGACPAPLEGLTLRQSVGACGTRFAAHLGKERIGMIEVATDLTAGGTRSRFAGWGDIGNLEVVSTHRRRGIGSWLLGVAADWLRLGRVERLLAYSWPEEEAELAFLRAHGFAELTRTERGWTRGSTMELNSMSDADLEGTVEAYHRACDEFSRGDPEAVKALFSDEDDITLANPFGPAVRGRAEVAKALDYASSRLREGDVGGFERLTTHASSELAAIVELEHWRAKVGERDEVEPFELRATSVFRQEAGSWRLVHRHADPITTPDPSGPLRY